MLRVPIRSRLGNGILGFLGVVYFVAAAPTLVYYIVTTWGAMSLTDDVLQVGLFGCAVGGLFFIAIARQNLVSSASLAAKSRSARDRQAVAAAGS